MPLPDENAPDPTLAKLQAELELTQNQLKAAKGELSGLPRQARSRRTPAKMIGAGGTNPSGWGGSRMSFLPICRMKSARR